MNKRAFCWCIWRRQGDTQLLVALDWRKRDQVMKWVWMTTYISTILQMKLQNNTSKVTQEDECGHNLMSVSHKVPDHHLHHELKGLATITHWPCQLLKMVVGKHTTSSSSCNDCPLWQVRTSNWKLPFLDLELRIQMHALLWNMPIHHMHT
jgi:hypothetical protein